MTGTTGTIAIAGLRFNPRTGEILGQGHSVKLRPKASTALALLVENAGELVTRDRLIETLWPDGRTILFEASVTTIIRELRRALGDNSREPRFIETIPRRGYRFIGPVDERREGVAPMQSRSRRRGFVHGLSRAAAFMISIGGALLLGVADDGVRSGSQASSDRALVVHPVQALTGDPDVRAVARVLTAELTTLLSRVVPPDIRVASGTRLENVPLIGADHLNLVTEIRPDGGDFVITSRLAGESGRAFLWSADYRRDQDDWNLGAREISARIAEGVVAGGLDERHGMEWEERIGKTALEAYREGRSHLNRRTARATSAALESFRQALGAAPDFADAHASLAEALMTWPGPEKTQQIMDQAEAAANRALELDPRNARAHWVLGQIAMFYERRWEEAGRRFDLAMRLSPADARIRQTRAGWLCARGRCREALREIELAGALDPASVAISVDVMLFHYFARDFDGTVRAARRLAALRPGEYGSGRLSILAYQAKGDRSSAARHARDELVRLDDSGEAERWRRLDDEQALQAYWDGAVHTLDRASERRWIDPAALATFHAQAGDTQTALDLVARAATEPYFSFQLPYLGVNPALDPLRAHPRFEKALRELGQAALSPYYESVAAAGPAIGIPDGQ